MGMYYEQEMTQNAIGQALGISRVKVYRLLKLAKEEGAVEIIINWPIKRHAKLERALEETFGLKEALVLKWSHEKFPNALPALGKLAASYLENLLQDNRTLAICLGRSTYATINAIRSDIQANIQIVQAVGSIPQAVREYDSSLLARLLAEKVGGNVVYLPSPVMADTTEAADIMRNQRAIKRTLITASTADIALIGIGALDPVTSSFVKVGFITPEELITMQAHGAVGDITWQIYTQDGQLYPCEFNQRVIGLTLDELRQIPTTIAVAHGSEKIQAIGGGLRTGVIDVLCTDEQTAEGVLALMNTL